MSTMCVQRHPPDSQSIPESRQLDPAHSEGAKLFEELVIPLLKDFYRVACRLERDPDRAQDLLQDSLLQGFRRFGQLRVQSSIRAWMGRILVRTYLNTCRRRATEVELLEPHAKPEASHAAQSEGPLDVGLLLSTRRVAHELKSALDRLPPDLGLAVFLVDVQGYPYGEAAEVLDVPPGTVASRVARGRAALRGQLRHLAEERGLFDK